MKGVYCLFIEVSKPINIKVGKLGKIKFQKGNYVYVGSAQNNLKNRIERHFRKRKNKFWHIDYLLANKNAKIKEVSYKLTKNKKEECKIAQLISKYAKVIKNFGSSDCQCKSHLFQV
jgi:Uri superfamily endonuclease